MRERERENWGNWVKMVVKTAKPARVARLVRRESVGESGYINWRAINPVPTQTEAISPIPPYITHYLLEHSLPSCKDIASHVR